MLAACGIVVAPIVACTALLDLQTARFDGDGGGASSSGAGSSSGSGTDGSDDGPTTVDLDADFDAGNSASCPVATQVQGDGVVPTVDVTCNGASGIQLKLSSQHCGACGHDCGAATCANGLCAKETVVPETARSSFLGANGTRVAWSYEADAAVTGFRFASADGNEVQTLSSLDGEYLDTAGFGDDFLLVPRAGSGMTTVLPLDGGAPFTVQNNNAATGVAVVRGNDVFMIVFDVLLRRITAVPNSVADTIRQEAYPIVGIAVGGQYVYSALTQNPQGAPTLSRVRFDKSGYAASPWTGHSNAVAVDGRYVYVFENETNKLLRLPLDLQASPETLMQWTGTPWDYATTILPDGDFIYVRVNKGGASGAILRVPRCGGPPLLLTTMSSLGTIGIIGDYVYWVDFTAGGIERVRK